MFRTIWAFKTRELVMNDCFAIQRYRPLNIIMPFKIDSEFPVARPPPKLRISKYLIIWFVFGIFSDKWRFYNINLLLSDFDHLHYDDEQAKNIIA